MRETESQSWTSLELRLLLRTAPYVLFYTGAFIWYRYGDVAEYFIAARYIFLDHVLNRKMFAC